jgi:hypothetical protein
VDTYFKQNKDQVIDTGEYISNLTHFDLLQKEDDAIYAEMQSVNKIKGIKRNEH